MEALWWLTVELLSGGGSLNIYVFLGGSEVKETWQVVTVALSMYFTFLPLIIDCVIHFGLHKYNIQ